MTKKKNAKRNAKKKATRRAKPKSEVVLPGKLVNTEVDGKKTLKVYQGTDGVTVLTHYEGASVAPEGTSPVGDGKVIARPPKEHRCPSCRGTTTRHLKSYERTASYRCMECVDRKTGKLLVFFLPREPRK